MDPPALTKRRPKETKLVVRGLAGAGALGLIWWSGLVGLGTLCAWLVPCTIVGAVLYAENEFKKD